MSLAQQLKTYRRVLKSETESIRNIIKDTLANQAYSIREDVEHDAFILEAGPARSYIVKVIPMQDTSDDIMRAVADGLYGQE